MGKTVEKLDDLLEQLSSLKKEVSKTEAQTADTIFDLVESGNLTKKKALTILTSKELLPIADYVCLPSFMENFEYFNRYSVIYYADYMYLRNFGDSEYASWLRL